MKFFDSTIPSKLKTELKEIMYGIEYYKNNLFKYEEIFSQVLVETNTACNRHCKICPVSTQESKGNKFMNLKTYELLLNQLVHINFSGSFSPVHYNEPLLDNRLPFLIEKAKSMLPKSQIRLYTNGSLLTKNNIDFLSKKGIDIFIVSQYIDNLPKDDLTELFNELDPKLLKKIRHRILTDNDLLSNRGGTVEILNQNIKNNCFQASCQVNVNYKGDILLCCNDYHGKYKYGNIHDVHIIDIWNNPSFKEDRKNIRKGIYKFELCQNCNS